MEYVVHDLTAEGNHPLKFSLIQDWSLLPHSRFLLSFIGLRYFYNMYRPWFETNIKPLQKLQRNYHRKNFPMIGWTPSLIKCICDCKNHLVTHSHLLRFDSIRPKFLEIDWSIGGMGYTFMHSDESQISLAAMKDPTTTGKCQFDLSFDGKRLRPVLFGSRNTLS